MFAYIFSTTLKTTLHSLNRVLSVNCGKNYSILSTPCLMLLCKRWYLWRMRAGTALVCWWVLDVGSNVSSLEVWRQSKARGESGFLLTVIWKSADYLFYMRKKDQNNIVSFFLFFLYIFQMRKKDQINIESKLKTVRYLGKLSLSFVCVLTEHVGIVYW